MTYPAMPKIPRWHREVVLTEKLDGTNGLVAVCPAASNWETAFPRRSTPPRFRILEDGTIVAAGSRKRWLNPNADNFGFAQWVWDNADELAQLGPGAHYGEWYGKGINRNYGLSERRFALFNVARWADDAEGDYKRPDCCEVVTVLARCEATDLTDTLTMHLAALDVGGSAHVPGFPRPEGVVLYHTAGSNLYKVTLEGDRAKTSDGFVLQPAGTKWLGLNGQVRELVTSPDDPAKAARELVNEWSNRGVPEGELGGELADEPGHQFAPVKVAA